MASFLRDRGRAYPAFGSEYRPFVLAVAAPPARRLSLPLAGQKRPGLSRIPNETLDAISSRISAVEVIGRFLKERFPA